MPKGKVDLPGGDVEYYPHPALGYDPDFMFTYLMKNTPWEQRSLEMYGKTILEPRKTMWYSPHSYTYSGLYHKPVPIPDLLQDLIVRLFHFTQTEFNGVLLNLYPDGKSYIGMHSDNEALFGDQPVIASVSLGAERSMTFKRIDKSAPSVKIPLNHGSMLVMKGNTQKLWQHGVPKTMKPTGPRINLTFRNIIHPQER